MGGLGSGRYKKEIAPFKGKRTQTLKRRKENEQTKIKQKTSEKNRAKI